MNKLLTLISCSFISFSAFAQVGIGTTSPNSTLDVRGSLSFNARNFTASTSISSTDYSLLFTGTGAATATLPDATACAGRLYFIKNINTATVPVLTIATTASQTIDGNSSWLLDEAGESVNLVSNGTNWIVLAQSFPSAAISTWNINGNAVGALKSIGTTTAYDLPFIVNNSEKMRITTSGNMGIGTSSFDATNAERLLVDAGTTSSFNVISGKGSIDSYLQLNIQNKSTGGSASSDVVATSNNGNESINFVDLGINSGTYTNTTYPIIGGANNAYLYSTGNDFAIGNATSGKSLQFFTGGYALSNERLHISGAGNIGINNTSPSEKLDVTGNVRFSGALMPNNSAGTAGYFLMSSGSGLAPTWFDPSSYLTASAWMQGGNSLSALKNLGTISNHDLPFITNNAERMRITTSGFLGLGTTSPAGRIHSVSDASDTGDDYVFDDYGSTVTQGIFMRKSRGTAASPANLTAGDHISYLRFSGRYNNTLGFTAGSGIDVYYQGDGTNDKTDMRLMTSNTERMMIDEDGNVGIGSSAFDATSPEKLLLDASTSTYTALLAKGNINNYLQINVKNSSTGNQGSSDIVATANNGTETTNFVDLGINGSGYVYQTGNPIETGKANDGYLLSSGNDFYIVNNNVSKDMIFLVGGTALTNEAMRITSSEKVGIATTTPTSTFSVNGSMSVAYRSGTGAYIILATDYVVINTGPTAAWTLPAASGCAGRVYKLINQGSGNITGLSVIQANGSSFTSIGTAAGSNYAEVLSDGTNWRRIN